MTHLASVHRDDADGTPLVRVVGEVDLSNAAFLLEQIASGVTGDAAVVVVDLSGTTYLDSAGISMLFRLGTRLRDTRRELRLVVPPTARIRAVLELTDVGRVVPLYERVSQALPPAG